ncbi:MAG: ATP-binding protein [Planctomycetota bacterium]|nr:ATP-binding protein [Planctomycetota bacterium]
MRLVVQSCAAAAGGGALAAATGWLVGHWSFTTFGAGYVPMPPSTAWLLVLLSAALWLHCQWPQRRLSRLFGVGASTVTGMFSLLVISHESGLVRLEFEAWLAFTTATVGDIPVARMSLHTAVTFLCAAGALGCLPGAICCPRWWRPPALALATAVSGSGAVAILGYAAGMPLLYGSGYVPMALLTAISLAVWGAGLMVAAYPDNWLLAGLTDVSGDAATPQFRRFRWALVAVFLVLLAGISSSGCFYLRRQLMDWRHKAEQELSTIADLQAAQLTEWRRERLANANLIRLTPYVARRALNVLELPNSVTTREMFTSWLERLLAVGPYEYALLLDAQRNVGLIYPKRATGVLSETVHHAAEQAFRTRQVVLSDVYRETAGGQVQLSVLVPLIVRRDNTRDNVPAAGVPPSLEDRCAGVLVLQINAGRSLCRFVKPWPTPSPTGETLLVQREADEVVYVSELRHRAKLVPRIRTPLSRREDLLVRAVSGEAGILAGNDYRDIPVLATTRAIRGTPWFLVAKVDQAEIYAPIRERGWTIISIVIGLALGVALSLRLLWRQRDIAFLQRQMAAERERGAMAARIAYLIKHASDILLLTDENLRIIEANNRALEIYGYTAEELQRLTLHDLQSPVASADMNGVLRPATFLPEGVFETVHQRKDGSTFPVEASVRTIEVEGRSIGESIIRDITERKRLEAELLRAKEAAEAANRAKSEFLANMSHEIRTPMTAILGYADLLLETHVGHVSQEHVAVIQRNGEYLLGLISDILDLSKVEAGKLQIEPICCSPCELVAEVVSFMRVRAAEKQLHLQTELAGLLPATVRTDPLRLRQVLINLLGNAIKFTDHGEIRLTLRLTSEDSPRLRFEVTDTGIGMNPEQVGQLFQPFTQVDGSPTRKFGGTGLGLCISKYLAEALGGDVEVRSQPGQGSTFTLTIDPGPLDGIRLLPGGVEAARLPPPCAAPAAAGQVVRHDRILLAEDSVDSQRLLSLLLRRAGAEVTVVENGQQAVAAAWAAHEAGEPFHVILMDMQMPVLDGFEATRQLRQRGYAAPIVALTAHAMAEDCQKCLAAGCNGYATKPIDRQRLLATVASWATRDGTPDAAPAATPPASTVQPASWLYSHLD